MEGFKEWSSHNATEASNLSDLVTQDRNPNYGHLKHQRLLAVLTKHACTTVYETNHISIILDYTVPLSHDILLNNTMLILWRIKIVWETDLLLLLKLPLDFRENDSKKFTVRH